MRKNTFTIFLLLYFVLVVFLYLSFNNPMQNIFSSFFVAIIGVFSVYAGLSTAQKYGLDNYHGRSFLIISLGFACWLLADTIFYFLQNIAHQSPFPSVADYVYLLGYPLIFWGLHREMIAEKIKYSFNKVIVPLVFSTILCVGIVYFMIFKGFDASYSLWENIFGISYGVGDLFLTVVSLFVLMKSEEYKNGKLYYPWQFICVGLISYLIADVLYYMNVDKYMSGEYYGIDFVYTFAYLIMAYGLFSVGTIIDEIKNGIFAKLKSANK